MPTRPQPLVVTHYQQSSIRILIQSGYGLPSQRVHQRSMWRDTLALTRLSTRLLLMLEPPTALGSQNSTYQPLSSICQKVRLSKPLMSTLEPTPSSVRTRVSVSVWYQQMVTSPTDRYSLMETAKQLPLPISLPMLQVASVESQVLFVSICQDLSRANH